jgi:hypothetical protein
MAQLFTNQYLLDLYDLCQNSRLRGVSSLTKHILGASVECYSSLIDIVKRSSAEVETTLTSIFDVKGVSLENKAARSGSPMDWSYVKVYGLFLRDKCLFYLLFSIS